MLTRQSFRTFVIAAALGQATTAAASAQSATGDADRRIDIERAVRLETEAESLFDQPEKLDKAARKMREAARLRPDEDRRALRLLGSAGALAYYAGDFRSSRAALIEQAERALSVGEVGIAAHALIDAAFAAKELDDVAAFDYIGRARLLASSTLLAANDRARITSRIGGAWRPLRKAARRSSDGSTARARRPPFAAVGARECGCWYGPRPRSGSAVDPGSASALPHRRT